MTASPPPQPPAGWYPDPTGKSGEMYWDGEAWHRLTPGIPATPKAGGVRSGNNPAPDIPATPEADIPATTQGRRWRRVIGVGDRPLIWNKQLILSLAAIVAIAVGWGLVSVAVDHAKHAPPSPRSGSGGNGGGADTSSHSYQEGFTLASGELVVNRIQGGMNNADACQAAFDMYQGAFSIDNHDQFMAGCADGLKQHPVPSYTPGFQPNP